MPSFICSAIHENQYPDSNAEVVFVGKSNVGKSSLINALYGKIAYTGKKAGKTKLLNFFNINNKYTACDVPGYGFAKLSDLDLKKFGDMMEEYFAKRSCLKLCVVILDIRRDLSDADSEMLDFLAFHKIPVYIVINKCDKLNNNELVKRRKLFQDLLSNYDQICISTLKNINIENVRAYIEQKLC